ncbi:MAG: hypothetical protein ACM3XM_00165 [Mycobacterium leprae]
MKRVVSVSIGSSKRDHAVQTELLGVPFTIERRGTDGDLDRAIAVLHELDGQVDAIGLGGLDVFLYVGKKRYTIGDGLKMLEAVKVTPAVDGSGIKNTLERRVIQQLGRTGDLLRPGSKVLLVSALDRFGMAEALVDLGCDVVFGDLIFAMGMDYPIKSLAELEMLADRYKSRFEKMPLSMLYPTGKAQEEAPIERHPQYYHDADVICGDFLLIKKYMPADLTGKTVITNTTTTADVEALRARGVATLVTTTPVLNGRSFGTNVLEAALVALSGKKSLEPTEYEALIDQLGLQPNVRAL